MTAALDKIVKDSLSSFYSDIVSDWCGREREMISLFVMGHLLKHCCAETVLYDATQIGIEVAVPQLPKNDSHRGRRETVCKDVVIWPEPKWTMWPTHREPLAVLEWKVRHKKFNKRSRSKFLAEKIEDIAWLREKSKLVQLFTGYAVFVDSACKPVALTCARLSGGEVEELWLKC